MHVMEISREIMDYLNAFRGSKPVVHNSDSMIIKGICGDKIEVDDRRSKLESLLEHLDFKEISAESERANTITQKIDQVFRNTTGVFDQSNGIGGIERLKHTFEITGFAIDYIIGLKENIAVFVAMWSDKSGVGPMFVEAMVVNIDAADDEKIMV